MNLMAYSAYDGYENTVIVFAKNSAEARRFAANEFDCDFEEVESCRRARQYDRYAPGPVPPLVLIDNGWWFICSGCEVSVESDAAEQEPVEYKGNVFCTEICHQEYNISNAKKTLLEAQGIKDLSDYLRAHFPDTKITNTYAYRDKQIIVYFWFPGCKIGDASLQQERGSSIELKICNGDLDAWYAYDAKRTEFLNAWENEGGLVK